MTFVHAKTILGAAGLVIAVPLVMWGAVVLVARVWKPNLRPLLPWLQVLRWITWLPSAAGAFAIAMLGSRRPFWFFLALSCLSLSIGVDLVKGWVERRHAPEFQTHGPVEYWPSPPEPRN